MTEAQPEGRTAQGYLGTWEPPGHMSPILCKVSLGGFLAFCDVLRGAGGPTFT